MQRTQTLIVFIFAILIILSAAICLVWYGNHDRHVDMSKVYATIYSDQHELPKAYWPGPTYTYVIKGDQVFALVKDDPNLWSSATELYYCPSMSDLLIEALQECNKVWPDMKPPYDPDAVVPYAIRHILISPTEPNEQADFSGEDVKVRECFRELRFEIIAEENEVSEIPDFVLDHAEIVKLLGIPRRYFKDKL